MTVLVKPQQHDGGLAHDFPALRRRRMMGLARGITVAALAGDARPDVLTCSGIVRDDIRRSFGKASGVARGVPLTVRLRLVSANSGRPLTGHAIYVWHADRQGAYSLYSPGLDAQNYLRGVQTTDQAGWVSFASIFPGASDGRWPHLGFEVHRDVAEVTRAARPLAAGQVALPGDACAAAYGVRGYEQSAVHLALASPVTEDGGAPAMATVTGDLGRGFVATRTIGI